MNVLRRPRILVACLFGGGLVLSAYIFAPDSTADQLPDSRLEAVVGKAPERDFIPVTDADKDGIPDWQQSLIDAQQLQEVNVSSTTTPDDSAVTPDTLTGEFARTFTKDIIQSKLYGTLDKNKQGLVENAASALQSRAAPTPYSETDLTLSTDTSTGALRAYGNRIVGISFTHSVPEDTRDVLTIMRDATANDDQQALDELTPIINAYQGMLTDTLTTPVPNSLSAQHLQLVNAYLLLVTDIKGMQQYEQDPLKGLIYVRSYSDDLDNLNQALIQLFTVISSKGVKFSANDTASRLIKVTTQ